MASGAYNSTRFVELLKFSPQQAFEYRLATLGTPIPDTYGPAVLDTRLNDGPFDDIKSTELIKLDLTKDDKTIEYTVADLKALLKAKKIEFKSSINKDELLKLAVENNLI